MASDTASSSEARPTVTVIGEAAIRTEPDEAIPVFTCAVCAGEGRRRLEG